MKPPVYRYLRGYSLDPGFSTRLDTAGINEVLYRVPFEPLEPGPVGEYLEVVDFDPAERMLVRAGRPAATSGSPRSTGWRRAKATRSFTSSSSMPSR